MNYGVRSSTGFGVNVNGLTGVLVGITVGGGLSVVSTGVLVDVSIAEAPVGKAVGVRVLLGNGETLSVGDKVGSVGALVAVVDRVGAEMLGLAVRA